MPCAKYNLQSERTFETPCKAGSHDHPRPQAYPTETSWAYLAPGIELQQEANYFGCMMNSFI